MTLFNRTNPLREVLWNPSPVLNWVVRAQNKIQQNDDPVQEQPMIDDQALLATILADPDDDRPRLRRVKVCFEYENGDEYCRYRR